MAEISEDARHLFVDGDFGFEVVSVATGETVIDLDSSQDVESRRWISSSQASAVLTLGQRELFELDIIDTGGADQVTLGDGRVNVAISEDGRLWVVNSDLTGSSEVSLWNSSDRVLDLIASVDAATVQHATAEGILITSGQAGNRTLNLVRPNGITEVAEVSDSPQDIVRLDDNVAIVEDIGDSETLTFMSLDGTERLVERGWDDITLEAYDRGALLATGRDGDSDWVLLLDLTNNQQLELSEVDLLTSAAFVGDTILLTNEGRRRETLPYARSTGEAIDTYDYDGLIVEPNFTLPVDKQLRLASGAYVAGAPCFEQGLRTFNVNQRIDIEPDETVCLFADGDVTITIDAADDLDPVLEVETGGQSFTHDDVNGTSDRSSRLDITVDGVALVTGRNLSDDGATSMTVVARDA